jgi:hypothetical protein
MPYVCVCFTFFLFCFFSYVNRVYTIANGRKEFVFIYFSEQTDSCSSISLTIESNKKQPTKPNVPHYQPTSRPTTITINEKSNGSLRESLDELNRLSTRMDNGIDNEHNR